MNDKHLINCAENALAYQPATLRDQFAMAALVGLLAGFDCGPENVPAISANSYIIADAMMKARE